jgi:hypothetical protein
VCLRCAGTEEDNVARKIGHRLHSRWADSNAMGLIVAEVGLSQRMCSRPPPPLHLPRALPLPWLMTHDLRAECPPFEPLPLLGRLQEEKRKTVEVKPLPSKRNKKGRKSRRSGQTTVSSDAASEGLPARCLPHSVSSGTGGAGHPGSGPGPDEDGGSDRSGVDDDRAAQPAAVAVGLAAPCVAGAGEGAAAAAAAVVAPGDTVAVAGSGVAAGSSSAPATTLSAGSSGGGDRGECEDKGACGGRGEGAGTGTGTGEGESAVGGAAPDSDTWSVVQRRQRKKAAVTRANSAGAKGLGLGGEVTSPDSSRSGRSQSKSRERGDAGMLVGAQPRGSFSLSPSAPQRRVVRAGDPSSGGVARAGTGVAPGAVIVPGAGAGVEPVDGSCALPAQPPGPAFDSCGQVASSPLEAPLAPGSQVATGPKGGTAEATGATRFSPAWLESKLHAEACVALRVPPPTLAVCRARSSAVSWCGPLHGRRCCGRLFVPTVPACACAAMW